MNGLRDGDASVRKESQQYAASGDAAYNACAQAVGRLPSAGAPRPRGPSEPFSRRLRRLHRVWPDRDGNISYLLTVCVEGRARVLDNEPTFQRLVGFLLDSPQRYHWFGRRFVVMPDHLHLIAHQGAEAILLGHWIKALKAVVGGLKRREDGPGASRDRASGDVTGNGADPAAAYGGEEPDAFAPAEGSRPTRSEATEGSRPAGEEATRPGAPPGAYTRLPRSWRWQKGFHDFKFRTPESEARKWEYLCLNPVRYGLVGRPEQWPFAGEIFYEDPDGPLLVRGTPALFEVGILMEPAVADGGAPRRTLERPGR